MKTITSKDITQGDWKLKAYGGELQISTDSHTINGTTICYLNEDTTEIKANAKAIANLPNLLKENESLRAINDELLEALKGLYDNPQPNPTIYHGADYFDRQSNNINAKINALEVITKATK